LHNPKRLRTGATFWRKIFVFFLRNGRQVGTIGILFLLPILQGVGKVNEHFFITFYFS